MWLVESAKRGSRMKDQYKVNGVDVFIKDRLAPEVDPATTFHERRRDYLYRRLSRNA